MAKKQKINICKNHLADFFEALKTEDLARIRRIEHVLTSEEKCVACSYIFKTKGDAKEALEDFLGKEGFEVSETVLKTKRLEVKFWSIRILILIISFAFVYLLEFIIKKILIGNINISFLSTNLIEYLVIGLIAIGIFLYIDDAFLD